MKLVEILARELKEWPVGASYARQDADLEICFGEVGCDYDFMAREEAEDNIYDGVIGIFRVPRDKWEAERARIAAQSISMPDEDVAFVKSDFYREMVDWKMAQELTSIACGKRSKEGQALWDRVAIASIPALIANPSEWSGDDEAGGAICSYEDAAKAAAFMADAFMAERAKRLDNSHTTSSTT